MATTPLGTELKLAPAVRSLLGSLRGWIRVYVLLEGLATAATWLGAAFWASLAIDWFFEPPPWFRGLMLAAVALVLSGVLVQLVLRRLFTRLSNSSMAMLLERRFPHFDDSLLTAVMLTASERTAASVPTADRAAGTAECNPQMLARTCHQAADRIGNVRLRGVFNPLPLQRAIMASVLLAVSIVAFGYLLPGAMNTWAWRNLAFDNDPWPRSARLIVDGFEGGVEKVARGADLEVIAKADTTWPMVPQTVKVRYRVKGGRRDRKPMIRLGTADPAKERFQEYSYTFQSILEPIRFDLVGEVKMGRDVRVPDLRIEVVDSPTLVRMTLHCKYPEYTALPGRPLPVPATGVVQIPRGTEVTVHAEANKDLVAAQVDATAAERSLQSTELTRDDLTGDRRGFSYTLKSLDEDTNLLFTLSDTDGITGREPVRLTLVAVADFPPQLTARLEGIGTAITPQARLPAGGQITDDYGIDEIWFEYAADQQDPATHSLAAPAAHPSTYPLKDAALEIPGLKLAPGQKLLVGVKAKDLCDLGEGPNVGASERWLLDVVTPDQLRAMLESRELVLRQRFEVIIQEVTETRDLLLRVDFGDGAAGEKTAETPAGEKPPAGAEPGDVPQQFSPERQLGLRTLRVQRALTNSSKNTHETQGVADGFDDIRLQLINNRIDTEELIRRLDEGIAKPLHHIAREMFPVLETRLERLQENLADQKVGPRQRDLARRQADAVLLEMRRVLDRMIELEDFNQAVELLRTIIKLQEQLEEQTKQRHKQRIRELLED